MNLEEYPAKALLSGAGLKVPRGALARSADEAAAIAATIGPCVVKAQVPTGKRGKSGGIKTAGTPQEARSHAASILGMRIDAHTVEKVLIEALVPIRRELYAAIVNDNAERGPALLFSVHGGMDVEESLARDGDALRRVPIDIRSGLSVRQAVAAVTGLGLEGAEEEAVASTLARLYEVYRSADAEMLEINPLVVTEDGEAIALDCKLIVDDSSGYRQPELAAQASPESLTALESEARDNHLKYIELDGSVGILANGAGLTMTTMDVVAHFGGRPANFLEIGGEAYTQGRVAVEILLKNPKLKSLLVNFCGAFARTDVMASGVVEAWKDLKPEIPIFFTIHGTGEDEAVALVEAELGIRPFDRMDDAVKAAVEAAGRTA